MEKDTDDLISILQEFAKHEGDQAFSDAVTSMASIWEEETWESDDVGEFKRTFDATAVALDRFGYFTRRNRNTGLGQEHKR